MSSINEILARAAALRDETQLNSISPHRAGSIMYDTLIQLNELWLQQGAALVISKIYASAAAMEADTAPVSDLTGQPLRPGQIVVIASEDSDNGSVYRYNGTESPSWSLVGEIGNLEPVDSLDSDSTQLPLAAHQGKVLDGKISQLGQKAEFIPIINSLIDFSEYTALFNWIGGGGEPTPNEGSLHYSIPLNGASVIEITANASQSAVFIFASSVSGNSWIPVGSRIVLNAGESQTINVPSGATYLIVGSRSNGEQAIDFYLPESVAFLSSIFPTIEEQSAKIEETKEALDERTLINADIDFSEYTALFNWIGGGGEPTPNEGSLHYSIPLNGASVIEITANSSNPAVLIFASAVSGDSWTYVGSRYVINVGETQTINVPSGANYLIVGSRSSNAQVVDFYLPESVVFITAISDAVVILQNEVDNLNDEVLSLKDDLRPRFAGGITLCTYNIGRFSHGNAEQSSVTENDYASSLALYKGILERINADIIFLDEYNEVFCPDYHGDVIYAKDVLFEDYPVRHISPNIPGKMYNVSVFSYRWLENISTAFLPDDESGRYYMIADYPLNGKTVKVVNMHFGFTAGDDDATTLAQITKMINLLAPYNYVILSGDMNMLADKSHFSILTDAGYTIANCGNFGDFETFIGSDPRVINPCIDQIAVKGFKMSNVRVDETVGASDHIPLVCDLIMTNI